MAEQFKQDVGQFIQDEIAKNNQTLLASMKDLLETSVQQIKRSSIEHAENQMNEIKKLKYSEPPKFRKKANEDQFRFNIKVGDTLGEAKESLLKTDYTQLKDQLEKGESLINERQKHILLADKSEFGWATVHEYKKHELADNSDDEKRIIKSEFRAKAQRKSSRQNSRLINKAPERFQDNTSQRNRDSIRGFSNSSYSQASTNPILKYTNSIRPGYACGKFRMHDIVVMHAENSGIGDENVQQMLRAD